MNTKWKHNKKARLSGMRPYFGGCLFTCLSVLVYLGYRHGHEEDNLGNYTHVQNVTSRSPGGLRPQSTQ